MCNNDLLGGDYDKEYAKVYKAWRDYCRSSILVPNDKLKIGCSPEKILKCVIGHFLASWVIDGEQEIPEILSQPIKECSITSDFREYLLNNKSLEEYKIYYWFYPYDTLRIDHAFGRGQPVSNKPVPFFVGSTIKMKPLAFCITSSDNPAFSLSTKYPNVTLLNLNSNEVILSLNGYPLENWPEEIPDNHSIILLNSNQKINVNIGEK